MTETTHDVLMRWAIKSDARMYAYLVGYCMVLLIGLGIFLGLFARLLGVI